MALQRSIRLALLLAAVAGAAVQAQSPRPFNATLTLSPTVPTPLDRIRVHAEVLSGPLFAFTGISRSGNTFSIVGGQVPTSPTPPPATYSADFDLGPLPEGTYTVQLGTTELVFSVAPANVLVLGDRFALVLLRGATVAASGQIVGGEVANPVRLTGESGYFWFFESGNVEVTVKMLDGSAVNGNVWLFAATMTDQPFVLEVYDTKGRCGIDPCQPKLYVNPPGQNQNFIDVKAFPENGVRQPGT